jgi:hypothetical protein
MFRDLSATAVTGDVLTKATQEPLASCDAAFSCLLKLGGRSGGSEAEAVKGRNVVNGETLPISRLIELAADLGLKAEHARLDWQCLQSLGLSHPLLVLLKNGNVILLTGGGGDGVSEVAVWDPGNPYDEILPVPREDFERASTGHALIITMPPSNGAETSPSSDFCWFTSAGLELLDKTSARAKNSKRLAQEREEPRPKSPARQTDRAMAYVARAEFAVARVELTNKQPTPGPAVGAQLSIPASSRAVAGRGLSPLVRFCIAVCVILTAAGSGTFLVKSSVTDAVAAAIAFAKDVWAVAPYGAASTDERVERVPPTRSAPILTAPAATPAKPKVAAPAATPAEPGNATPPIEPAAPRSERTTVRVERTTRRPAARPVSLSADSDGVVAPAISAVVPEAAAPRATPLAEPEAAAPPAVPAATTEAEAPFDTPRPGLGAAAAAPDAQKPTSPPPVAGPRLSAEEMAAVLTRGDSLLSVGDIASARLFYERGADAGGGLAAIRLGETFDQLFLDRVRLRGVRGDPGAALFWYRRARDLGAADAEVLMKTLEAK